ncbi:Rpn family recombination-promoting nuclease/putative transposase [Aureispira anguillae]|uniref:Rpn family recombination-promoting nuclease/putative transposase n=1 Tax=Aureispira anguillae TaxID=2864201 RepID=A0A916DUT7_9BACT|nr:Rpn family recombination-promoting nuclease/putative transposase [Aureispira anguillae]BDS12521.1 Rpn family recombination-promoting nuclease/putative transposase [Aureispira anguillae]
MKKTKELIRFDWAIKKLLRNKANFDILEGFLSELLSENITIKQILESESNKETENDRHNRVDILVENSNEELVIIEVQNSKEYDYFHRILYGTSKIITEYINRGEAYAKVKKIISITIAYFDLGQGKDYIYHGTHQFKGVHYGDVLNLAEKQKDLYQKEEVYEIFPEYWLLKVSKFNDAVQDKLDEWIYFLKNGKVQEGFTAQGLVEAKEKLDEMKLSDQDRREYNYFLKRLRDIASEQHTKMADAEDLLKKGRKEGLEKGRKEGIEKTQQDAIIGFFKIGVSPKDIADALNLSLQKVIQTIENYKK